MSAPPGIPPAIPLASMPAPDPKYLRPSIGPKTLELQLEFERACASGDLADVAELVDAGPRSPEYLSQGLFSAIYHKNVEIVKLLLGRGVAINRAVPVAAAKARSLPIFQLLLEHGWDINAPVMWGETVLMSILDDEQLVRWFLEHGAQLNPTRQSANACAPNTYSNTTLDKAACISSIAVFDMLLESGATRTNSVALHAAAGAGKDDERIPMMAHLIELGYDVNATDEVRGYSAVGTPLQCAIMAKSPAKVRFLLEKGADPRKPVGSGGSPFKMAEGMGLDEVVDLLKQYS